MLMMHARERERRRKREGEREKEKAKGEREREKEKSFVAITGKIYDVAMKTMANKSIVVIGTFRVN